MVAHLLETQLRSLYQWPALMGYAQLLRRPLHDAVHAAVDANLALEDLDHLGERHRRRAPRDGQTHRRGRLHYRGARLRRRLD